MESPEPGSITFDPTTLSCATGGQFTAAVVLKEPAGTTGLVLAVSRAAPAAGVILSKTSLAVTASTVTFQLGPMPVAPWCTAPAGLGLYSLLIVRPADGTPLANGKLLVVP